MARVFTITPGLENMGAMKTGGQGSVYKARRIGEVITAVKILPTPIYSESADDKNFTAFQNEVNKLKKVNKQPNPNVVKILNSGITESGNLPFIEMEFIEGPDLEDLLKPPHDPVFTIKEVLKVAEQLSSALAHCHKLDVKHGDIKSNNIKFSNQTANYVLLDFGLAIMSDEERRSSLKQAGAIEFMAPEQNTGQMLFQTDVYSFGIILYELLTGTVPFPLKDRSESARNEVRLAHMVNPVPDLLQLRQESLPDTWDEQKKQHEMNVPEWLVNMIYKCLEKKPAGRFTNGVELHDFIIDNFINSGKLKVSSEGLLIRDSKNLPNNQKQLEEQLSKYKLEMSNKDQEIRALKTQLSETRKRLQALELEKQHQTQQPKTGVSKLSFTLLLFITIILAAFAIFSAVKSNSSASNQPVQRLENNMDTALTDRVTGKVNKTGNSKQQKNINTKKTTEVPKVIKEKEGVTKQENSNTIATEEKPEEKKVEETVTRTEKDVEQLELPEERKVEERKVEEKKLEERKPGNTIPQKEKRQKEENAPPVTRENAKVVKSYKVVSKAYFYNEPDEFTKQDLFISPLENAVVDALNEKYGFVFVEIRNPQGRFFRGWLSKKDLRLQSIH